MRMLRAPIIDGPAAVRLAAVLCLLVCPGAYAVIAQISAGADHALALRSNGTVWAWGRNSSAQLGDGTTTQRTTPEYVGPGFISVSAGSGSSFAIKSDGTLWAWGDNSSGQLGDGSAIQRYARVSIGGGYRAVAAGQSHTLALDRKSTRLNSSHSDRSRMPSSA